MSNLIEQIHQDHVNMARILKLINSEIDALIAEEPRDLEILDDAMRYMISYADKIHHVKEDVMFRRLVEVAPETQELVDDIANEHESIVNKGAAFYELVRAVEVGDFVLRKDIIAKGHDYVQTLYKHMSKEENDILKKAQAVFSPAEFADLESNHGAHEDPLFSKRIQTEFEDLYNHILDQYGQDWLHPAHELV